MCKKQVDTDRTLSKTKHKGNLDPALLAADDGGVAAVARVGVVRQTRQGTTGVLQGDHGTLVHACFHDKSVIHPICLRYACTHTFFSNTFLVFA